MGATPDSFCRDCGRPSEVAFECAGEPGRAKLRFCGECAIGALRRAGASEDELISTALAVAAKRRRARLGWG